MPSAREYNTDNFLDNHRARRPLGLPEGYRCTHWVLPVGFDDKSFNLSLVTVNPKAAIEARISIAWIDCREKGLGEAIGRDLGQLVTPLVDEKTILITPPSKKSIGMAVQVLATAIHGSGNQDLELVKIHGSKTAFLENQIAEREDMVLWQSRNKGGDIFGVNYTPVTGTRKSMWLEAGELSRLTGQRVIAVDDVATTRATIKAWELLLATGAIKEEFIVTAAVEGEFQMETNHQALIRLPEIRGRIESALLGR